VRGDPTKLDGLGRLAPVSGFSRLRSLRVAPSLSVWCSHDGIRVLSGLHDTVLPGTDHEIGPQWLVSVSRSGRREVRPSDDDVRRVVEGFAMPAFDEDNHHPGVARHLFCPVAERHRSACECKLTERLVTEVDGYQWTTDDGSRCRGCEYEGLTGMPCTIHRPPRSC
jgi:hypothetical protein